MINVSYKYFSSKLLKFVVTNILKLIYNISIELLPLLNFHHITGGYLLTQKDEFLTSEQAMQLAACFLAGADATMSIDMPEPAILKPRRLYTGKQIFSLLLKPNNDCPVKANLVTSGKNYTKGKDLCVRDSFVIIR